METNPSIAPPIQMEYLFTLGGFPSMPVNIEELLNTMFPPTMSTEDIDPIMDIVIDFIDEDPDPKLVDAVLPRYLTSFELNLLYSMAFNDLSHIYGILDDLAQSGSYKAFEIATDTYIYMWPIIDPTDMVTLFRTKIVFEHFAPGLLFQMGLHFSPFEAAFAPEHRN